MNTTTTTKAAGAKPPTVTEAQKRSIACPRCDAGKGKPCKSSRIPGPNTFGGGWGGPPDLDTAHRERRAAYLAKLDTQLKRNQARTVLVAAMARHTGGDDCVDTRGLLGDALAAYEATGDHDHGKGPIAAGAPCPVDFDKRGGDCIVAQARELLAKPATPTPIAIGSRVRVRIVAPQKYAHGAAAALDGMTGTVERFKSDGEVLVWFDKPAPTWWTHQTPATAFWFPPTDLVAETQS